MQRYLLCLYLTVICSSARTASCVCTGEYLWAHGPVMIAFSPTNGFLMDYPPPGEKETDCQWTGNQVSWVKKVLMMIPMRHSCSDMKWMMYAGTLSLDNECTAIDISRIKAGDMFIKRGKSGALRYGGGCGCERGMETSVSLLAQGYKAGPGFPHS